MINGLMLEAHRHHVAGVCLFTRIPDYFAKLGFEIVPLTDLPDKIYKDCLKCPKLNACDEVAMVKGEVPKMSILQQARMFARPVSVR